MSFYNSDYSNYHRVRDGFYRAAREVIPIVLDLVDPKSVVDLGCGIGTWLKAFKDFGINDTVGINGKWVDKRLLEISETEFITFDLKKPFRLGRRFDLVVSLEVAEHLPEPCAETFVDSLVRLGPVVLFSAAIPYQGGNRHVNEKWPIFWVTHFKRNRFLLVDCMRTRLWHNENVKWWYAQNMFMFVQENQLGCYPKLKSEYQVNTPLPLNAVHPKNYLRKADAGRWSFRHALRLTARFCR